MEALGFVFAQDQTADSEESLVYLLSYQFSCSTSACKQVPKGFVELLQAFSIMDGPHQLYFLLF